ncbi:MAG: hypothetical protein KTR14_00160 [Vampirovibrio sp.]|nr:hypothetical protein [Vampirovibrio sp.]
MMNKFFSCLLAVTVSLSIMTPTWAAAATINPDETIRVVGTEQNSEDVKSILSLIQELMDASNNHDLPGVLKNFSPRFVSGDNLSLQDVKNLIEDTWKTYPDIKYETKTLEIRINGDWATVESIDTAIATAKSDDGNPDNIGTLQSKSRGLLFLRRLSRSWEIQSDYTIYEQAKIAYGKAKNLDIILSTPDQVFAGESYTARVDIDVASGNVAIASITNNPLIYPQPKPEEKFRTMTDRQADLERVFEANSANKNEIVTATIGITEIGQGSSEHPTITLNGVATIVKRVNVLPVSQSKDGQDPTKLVKKSANGKLDYTQEPKAEADANKSDGDIEDKDQG